jgi:formylglycine-generating enzyme required for sulfatase activity
MNQKTSPDNRPHRMKKKKLFETIVLQSLVLLSFSGSAQKNDSLIKEVKPSQAFSVYTESIPGTKIHFDMLPIPAGVFSMGSSDTEKNHQADEGPVHPVKVDAFWMGQYEITWDEYELFVYPNLPVDGITGPTAPFVDMSFGMGKTGYPAVNMTQYAALGYCRWLTAKTGHFYRLPTEAEWEYACRAGSATAYSFGDDEAQLADYAWYSKNSKEKYHKVGTKKPNNWGLYDMHGNVAEWTLDQYIPDYYTTFKSDTAVNPWAASTKLYPQSVRGGSWDDDPESLRSAARRGSSPKWKDRDPQIPRSNWWNTDASFLGFRIVRPLRQPSPEEIKRYFAKPPEDL